MILTQYHHRLVERLPIVQLFTFLLGIFIVDITHRHFDLLKVRITFWCMFCGFIAVSLLPGGTVYSLWLRTICFAVLCVYVFQFVEEKFILIFKNSAVKTVVSFGAQISFMFFLCHHQIIINFNRYCMGRKFQSFHQPVVIAVCLLVVTILVSWLLNRFAQFFITRIQFEALREK